MNRTKTVALCIIMALLGWSAKGSIPLANAQSEKIHEYTVKQCGASNPDTVASCLNSMARQGWRVHAPWGSVFVIFERER